MTIPCPQAWYIYCVVPAAADAPAAEGILPGSHLEAVAANGVTVLASLVPRAFFDESDPASRTADPDWMAARVEAHHAVIAAAAAAGPCLPLAFGALFSSLDLLRDWIGPRTDALCSGLNHVAGHAEWVLLLQEDGAAHVAWLDRHDPDLRRMAETVAAAGEGTAYLLLRRLDKARGAARTRHLDAIAATVGKWIGDAGFQIHADRARAGLPAWSSLIPDDATQALSDRAALLAADLAHAGLSLQLSGPWPAYAFARGALSEECVHA